MVSEDSQDSDAGLLAALDPEQQIAAESLRGPTCIIAGAGSGKTRTVSHRIALGIQRGVFAANRVLALTYTNRAAAELRLRLRDLGAGAVTVRTFHSAALSQLQYFWPQLADAPAPRLLSNKQKLLGEVTTNLGLKLAPAALRDLASEIEWRKYTLTEPEAYAALERPAPAGLSQAVSLKIQEGYESLKLERKLIDWEDVLLLTLGMLSSEPRLLAHVQQQFRFFTVDEYQDISPLQQALLEVWVGSRSDLCVVGDPRQTIYTFAGASSTYLTGFADRFEAATEVHLTRNYRSSPEIVEYANQLLSAEPLTAQGAARGPVLLLEHQSPKAEIDALVQRVSAQLSGGMLPQEIAVLTRINSQLEPIEAALSAAGIATQLRGGNRYFQRPEIIQAVGALRALQAKVEREPLFIEVSNVLASLGWVSRQPDGETDRWEALNWLIEILDEMPSGSELDEYLRELDERQRSQHEPVKKAVALATVHAAKGLEWQAVHLPHLNEGSFPLIHAVSDSEIAEERRLLYVAVTRAKFNLSISWSGKREKSRFLAASRL